MGLTRHDERIIIHFVRNSTIPSGADTVAEFATRITTAFMLPSSKERIRDYVFCHSQYNRSTS